MHNKWPYLLTSFLNSDAQTEHKKKHIVSPFHSHFDYFCMPFVFHIIIIIISFAIFFRSICHLITNECTEEKNKKTNTMNFEPSSSCVLCAHEKILFLNNISVAFIYSPISRCAFTHTRTQSTRNDNNALLLNRKNKAENDSKGKKRHKNRRFENGRRSHRQTRTKEKRIHWN